MQLIITTSTTSHAAASPSSYVGAATNFNTNSIPGTGLSRLPCNPRRPPFTPSWLPKDPQEARKPRGPKSSKPTPQHGKPQASTRRRSFHSRAEVSEGPALCTLYIGLGLGSEPRRLRIPGEAMLLGTPRKVAKICMGHGHDKTTVCTLKALVWGKPEPWKPSPTSPFPLASSSTRAAGQPPEQKPLPSELWSPALPPRI